MKRPVRLNPSLGLVFVFLMLVSCASPGSLFAAKPTPTFAFTPNVEPAAKAMDTMPAYTKPGANTVARITTKIMDGSVEVETYLWYPANANGTPNLAGGPYPLVVFAPGGFENGIYHQALLHHLASYGLITASWNPRNEETDEGYYLGSSYRPLDMKSILDGLEQMTAPGGQLAGLIDMKHIVAGGYSQGGGNALLLSGALRSFGWCAAHADLIYSDEEGPLICLNFLQHQDEIAKVTGLDHTPKGFWPSMGDSRIIALIAMAPLGKYWGPAYEGVAAVKVPTLVMVGSEDTNIKPELGAKSVYEHLGSPKKTLVVFQGKDHFFFTVDPQNDPAAYPLFNITTAFVLAEAKSDKNAAQALSPSNTNSPDFKLETTEFNSK